MKKYGKYETQPVAAAAKQPKAKSVFLQTYLTSLLCMVLCVSMFFGTSFAWFTSEVESTGNEIYIGILKVNLDKKVGEGWKSLSDAAEDNVKLYTNAVHWEPGYTSVETVRVMNKGDLAFNYVLTFTDGKLDGKTDAELQAVAEWFDVWVYNDANNAIPTTKRYEDITAKDSGWKEVGTLAEVLNGKTVFEGKMDKEDVAGKQETAHTYTIALHMNGERIGANQKEALNALMGKKIELSVKLVATQRSSEKDGFGDAYYDAANPVYTAKELQEALDNATGNTEITLASDITGDVIVNQPGDKTVNIVIDGKGHKYDGQIKIKGNSSSTHDDALTIKNINFVTGTASREFIWSADSANGSMWRYAHNVTVDNCTFTASGDAVHTAVGVKFQQAYNIKVTNCTATNMHTLLQAESCGSKVTVENSKVVSGKNGVSFNNTMDAVIKNTEIQSVGAGGYGVRHKGEVDNYSLSIENCKIDAFVPVLIRNMKATGYTATLSGTNTLVAANTFGYQIVVSAGDWDSDSAAPAAPTGTFTLTGVDGLNVFKG